MLVECRKPRVGIAGPVKARWKWSDWSGRNARIKFERMCVFGRCWCCTKIVPFVGKWKACSRSGVRVSSLFRRHFASGLSFCSFNIFLSTVRTFVAFVFVRFVLCLSNIATYNTSIWYRFFFVRHSLVLFGGRIHSTLAIGWLRAVQRIFHSAFFSFFHLVIEIRFCDNSVNAVKRCAKRREGKRRAKKWSATLDVNSHSTSYAGDSIHLLSSNTTEKLAERVKIVYELIIAQLFPVEALHFPCTHGDCVGNRYMNRSTALWCRIQTHSKRSILDSADARNRGFITN